MSERQHPRHQLDEVLQLPVRLSIVAALDGVVSAQFRAVRDTVELSDAALSKQVTILEDAGYVEVSKQSVGRRTRTWLALTDHGRNALRQHLNALQEIVRTTAASPQA